jgi:hypothetical protein
MKDDLTAASPVEAATAYARRGWSVVPMHSLEDTGECTCGRKGCPSPGKHPRLRWEEAMTQPADDGMVQSWWERWPHSNVGVVTGRVSGVAVIDVDPRHNGDETLFELEVSWGRLPQTLESRTGGGGRHLWYAMPDRDLVSVDLGDGVELKAERGLVIAPPSRHASGRIYRWLDPGEYPTPLPAWVADLADGHHPAPVGGEQPIRTTLEQQEFREAWSRAGVEVRPGDHYYLCPFHDDHHPSLHIDADGCRWYCFACRLGGGTGALLRRLGAHAERPPVARMRGRVGPRRPITLHGDAPVEVVGESFHQDELLRITGGHRRFGGVDVDTVVDLVPLEEDGIEVRVGGDAVGYLHSPYAERLLEMISESVDLNGFASCRASIRGGWDRGGENVGMFGVTLWLPEESEAV